MLEFLEQLLLPLHPALALREHPVVLERLLPSFLLE
jgi:hypothetical protein